MKNARKLLSLLLLSLWGFTAGAQVNGIAVDIGTGKPLANVNVENLYTQRLVTTDSSGRFSVVASKGQLIEFRKMGYKTERLRLPEGILPPFFKVHLDKGAILLPEVITEGKSNNWKRDSQRFHQLYKHELEFPEFSALDVIQHPFSALSKRNRQIWAFQKEFTWFEQEKYIDYTFNMMLIKNLTGLSGDSLNSYMRTYRPGYEQLRSMKEYDFYVYITRTADRFRSGDRRRGTTSRSSN